MKILLIHPMKRGRTRTERRVKPYMLPLTLPTIAGLTPKDFSVEICDESVEEVNLDTHAELIGITGITSQINRAYQIADQLRHRGKTVVMGGIHVSAMPDEAREHADSILVGEAEDLWVRILEDHGSERLKEQYVATDFPNLQAKVLPRYELMKLERYRRSSGSSLPRIPVQTTRGCPFNCSFCSVTRFWGPRIRTKPIENVQAELSHIKALGTNRIFFTDDNFIANTSYTRDLLSLLRKENFSWSCQVSTNIQEAEDVISDMASAGCTSVYVGIESFSDQNLSDIKKQINMRADYERLFSDFSSVGIRVMASMMIGLDSDTEASLRDMVRGLIRLKASAAQFYLIMVLPGTRLREQFSEQGRIIDQNWDCQDGTKVTFAPRNFKPEELQQLYWTIYRQFYSFWSICRRILNRNTLKKGLRAILIPLRANMYFRRRIKRGLHPIEN